MSKHILLIQGHPDASQRHLCHELEDAYAQGAMAAGHQIKRLNVATLNFPIFLFSDFAQPARMGKRYVAAHPGRGIGGHQMG